MWCSRCCFFPNRLNKWALKHKGDFNFWGRNKNMPNVCWLCYLSKRDVATFFFVVFLCFCWIWNDDFDLSVGAVMSLLLLKKEIWHPDKRTTKKEKTKTNRHQMLLCMNKDSFWNLFLLVILFGNCSWSYFECIYFSDVFCGWVCYVVFYLLFLQLVAQRAHYFLHLIDLCYILKPIFDAI